MSTADGPREIDGLSITHLLNEVAAKAAERSESWHPEDIGLAMTGAIEDAVLVLKVMEDGDILRWRP